jgi:hypothetical protein
MTVKKHMLFVYLWSTQYHLFFEAVFENVNLDPDGLAKSACRLENAGSTTETGDNCVIT